MMLKAERRVAINQTLEKVRSIFGEGQPDRDKLDAAMGEIGKLAKLKHLFSLDDFPPPEKGGSRSSCLYRLSEDDDHRFALYANSADGKVDAPPHDHTTWAVIVGLVGQEENRFYRKVSDGVEVTGGAIVEEGTGVALMPDDLHSIHIKEGKPVLNFHMYGLALEQLPGRNYWSDPKKEWKTFPAHTDIREAR